MQNTKTMLTLPSLNINFNTNNKYRPNNIMTMVKLVMVVLLDDDLDDDDKLINGLASLINTFNQKVGCTTNILRMFLPHKRPSQSDQNFQPEGWMYYKYPWNVLTS